MPKTIEQRVTALEETMKILYSVVIEKKPYFPSMDEYWRAIEALQEGDTGPLERYMKAGGEFPTLESLPKRKGGGRRVKKGFQANKKTKDK